MLANVDTWRLGERAHREEVLDRLDELVLKPVDGSGGKGIVIGPNASAGELDELRAKVLEDPRAWIAQPVVQLSTVPTLFDDRMRPRHVDLRPFAVNDGHKVWVLPGGLTRVALPEGELIVNSSRGGGSKDTWVLAGGRAVAPRVAGRARAGGWHAPPLDTGAGIERLGHAAPSSRPSSNSRPGRGGAVLSRIAESMFWIGRYVERAEDTARILDVQMQMMVEDPAVDIDSACRTLLSVYGHRHPARGPASTLEATLLTGSPSTPTRARRSPRRRRGPGERPPGPRDAVDGDVGGHQLDLPATCPSGRFRAMRTRTRSAGCASGPRSSTAPPMPR